MQRREGQKRHYKAGYQIEKGVGVCVCVCLPNWEGCVCVCVCVYQIEKGVCVYQIEKGVCVCVCVCDATNAKWQKERWI